MFPNAPLSQNLSDSRSPSKDDWDVLYPSISCRDWSIHTMSAPSLKAATDSKAGLGRKAWLFAPQRAEAR